MGDRLQVYRDAEAVLVAEANRIESRRRDASRSSRAVQRAKRLLRVPPWADLRAIAEFYRQAADLTRRSGVAHEVDHIIPMIGKLVSGLHVESNLRVVTKAENRLKSNHFDVEVVGGAGIEPATSTV